MAQRMYHGFFYEMTEKEYRRLTMLGQKTRTKRNNTKVIFAIIFLKELLAHGAVRASEGMDKATAAGFKADVIFRARKQLGVEVRSFGRRGSEWSLS